MKFLVFIFGIVPSLAFFVWIAQGCDLPLIGAYLGFPLFGTMGPLWNIIVFGIFAGFHTGLAGNVTIYHWEIENWKNGTIPRSIYMIVTGTLIALMISTWDRQIYDPIWTIPLFRGAEYVPFVALIAFQLYVLRGFGTLEFVGLVEQSKSKLLITGPFNIVRHPMHLALLLAFFSAPTMTVDRFMFCFMTVAYLGIAIPIEERKLVKLFGKEYVDYQRQVPCLIPFLRW